MENIIDLDRVPVTLTKKDGSVVTGIPCDIREVIEEMIGKKLGFTPSLQESMEEDENEQLYLEIYLHTDTYDFLDDSQLEQLDDLDITEDGEETTAAIKKLLEVELS